MKIHLKLFGILTAAFILLFDASVRGQEVRDTLSGYPVTLESDTLFFIVEGIGTFSADKRAIEISSKLKAIAGNDEMNADSIVIVNLNEYRLLRISDQTIMAVSRADAELADMPDSLLAENYRHIITASIKEIREIYGREALINNSLLTVIYIALLVFFFWASSRIFPWTYNKILLLGSSRIKDIKLGDQEFVGAATIKGLVLIFFKGLRFAFSLYAVYLFITTTISLWPYTRKLDVQPVIKSVVLFIFYTAFFYALFKGLNSLVRFLLAKYDSWRDTVIKSVRIKSYEILPADRVIGFLKFATKVFRFALFAVLFYSFLTIIFSLFSFSETWADSLLELVLNPLSLAWSSFLNFLPNLFFIVIIITIFFYLIKGVKFFFLEMDKGTLLLPGFHKDWATPTYKIVRFLIIVLATIVIFPYLPGSDSPFFQGISVFLGILFSLGSSSAVANMVAGIVLTYMRPFKIGDRVKIADTTGDVVDKTLLVTRVRTIKNVDVTIPNAMVLGSHIINYSSSAEEKGLILHTTVTIGYDVPWKKVHELLISAAEETNRIIKEPKPFVLQTSLDDFYVSYELNAFTETPQKMIEIYSELHSKIQDKFNDAGMEIMSPHYSAVRDGNETAIPNDYLPKDYKPKSFRFFDTGFNDSNKKE